MRRAHGLCRRFLFALAMLSCTESHADLVCQYVDNPPGSDGARFLASAEQMRAGAAHAELSYAVYTCRDACGPFSGQWGNWKTLLDSREQSMALRKQLQEQMGSQAMPGSTPPVAEIPLDPSGFHGVAYASADGKSLVIAFEGTSSLTALPDWATDIALSFWKPLQVAAAETFARTAVARFCGTDSGCTERVSVTGHSLGGALGQYVALRLGLKSYTFNALGLGSAVQGELEANGQAGFSGFHFFSQGYRVGSELGMDIVPHLPKYKDYAQIKCEVPIQLPALAWGASVYYFTHNIQRLSTALTREAQAKLPVQPAPAAPPSPPLNVPPAVGPPTAGSTPPVIGSPAPASPRPPPLAGGSVPALVAELGSLTGNARYAAFSDALANARVPARLSVKDAVDVGRGMNEYHEPYMRLVAARITGPLTAAQVNALAADTQGLNRFKIVTYLGQAGLLRGPFGPADIALIVRNMELYRAPTISLLARVLTPNMGAREVISLFGRMSSPIRLATLSELKSAGRLKNPLTAEEVDAIAVTFGMFLEGTARDVLNGR